MKISFIFEKLNLNINQQKEQFSNAYLQAISAVAGYTLYKPFVDDDSVDWGIAAKKTKGNIRAPRLELQLKSTSVIQIKTTKLSYPLKLKNYNDLRPSNFAVPRILVVLIVPEKLTDWLRQTERELCLMNYAYWQSLRGMPATKNTSTVNIEIPRRNQLTVAAMQNLMENIAQGIMP